MNKNVMHNTCDTTTSIADQFFSRTELSNAFANVFHGTIRAYFDWKLLSLHMAHWKALHGAARTVLAVLAERRGAAQFRASPHTALAAQQHTASPWLRLLLRCQLNSCPLAMTLQQWSWKGQTYCVCQSSHSPASNLFT